MDKEQHTPPKIPSAILRFLIREEYLEEIQGDLEEIYTSHIYQLGKTKARLYYFMNSLRFIRLENIKSPQLKLINPMTRNNIINAFRTLRREKFYTSFNLLGLTIGITGMLLSFLFIIDEIQYDRFHSNYSSIYRMLTVNQETATRGSGTAGAWAPAAADQFAEIVSFVRMQGFGRSLVSHEDKVAYENGGVLADSSFFDIFSIPLLKGSKKMALQGPNKVVLSEAMATKYFGTTDVIGKLLKLDGTEMIITGISGKPERGSDFIFDFYVSIESSDSFFRSDWLIQNFSSFLIIKEGTDIKQLSDKTINLIRSNTQADVLNQSLTIDYEPLSEIHLFSTASRSEPLIKKVVTFGIIGIFIIIISIINFVNLRSARSLRRTREVGIRKALGGQRNQLTFLFLTETFLLTFLAGAISILTVILFLPAFNNILGENLSYNLLFDPLWGLVFIFLIGLIAILAGAYPALLLSSMKPIQALREKISNRSNQWVRRVLIVFQLAVSGILIAGTWVAINQMNFIESRDLGFNHKDIITVSLQDRALSPKMETMANAFLSIPGVTSVALSANKLGGGEWGWPFRYEGSPDQNPMGNRYMSVDPEYIETLNLKLVAGRNFNKDLESDKDSKYIVNEAFVKAAGWETGVGKRLEMPKRDQTGAVVWTPGEIIGVVNDFNFLSLHTEVAPLVIDYEPNFFFNFFLKIDTNEIAGTLKSVESTWAQFSNLPLDFTFVDQVFNLQYKSDRNLTQGFKIFSGLAIFLAILGLLSLSSYTASIRAKEIGMRKVLGASNFQILAIFNSQYVKMVMFALVVMLGPSWWLIEKYLNSFAYKISINVWLFIGSGFLLLLLVVATVTLQTSRVISANPVKSLRQE